MSLKMIAVFVCLAVVPALGQQIEGGWEIRTSSVVSPASPSTTVEIWAAWNDPSNSYCCFVFGNFDLVAQEGVLSSPSVLLLPNAGWSQPGQVTGNGEAVRGVFVGQGIELPPHSPPNPILVWSATWTTTNFAPRSVGMWTENTTDFTVGKPSLNILQLLQLFPDNFVPGVGGITIVPSPASATPMVVVGALMLRRRRPR